MPTRGPRESVLPRRSSKSIRRPDGAKSGRLKKSAGQSIVGPEDGWSRFYLIKRPLFARKVTWDPWPVQKFNESALFKAAKGLIGSRNTASLDNSIDKIVLLPASGSIPGVHGGTGNLDLYSLRSPSMLPRRIHLWMTRGGKIMVRTGVESKTLVELLKGHDATNAWGSVKHLRFWKTLSLSANLPKQLMLPESLKNEFVGSETYRSQIYRRWRAITIFPFLELPAEVLVALLFVIHW